MPFSAAPANMVLSVGSFGESVRIIANGLDLGSFKYGASFGKLVVLQQVFLKDPNPFGRRGGLLQGSFL